VQPNAAGQGRQGSQRLQVVLEQVVPGGEGIGVGTDPAEPLEQAHADRVQGQAPWREQPHVPPLRDVRADLGTRLEGEGL
jgi:hypothetical protein